MRQFTGFFIRFSASVILLLFLSACTDVTPTVQVSFKHIDSSTIVIQKVSVFDSQNLQIHANQDVVIQSDKIVSVSEHNPRANWPNAHFIDGSGATLVPGLIDMHGHIATTTKPSWEFGLPTPNANLAAYAYSGVTTVFDPFDSSGEAYSRREKVARGQIIGPQVFTTASMLTSDNGHPRSLVKDLAPWWIRWYLIDKVGTAINNKEDAINAVNQRAEEDADAIKVAVDLIPLDGEQLSGELLNTIVSHGKQKGLRTVAHIGTTQDAINAAEAGVALWVHGVYKERIPDDKIEQLVSYGIPMVPTSEVFDRYGRSDVGPINPTKLEIETVAKSVLDSFYPIPEDFDIGPLRSWVDLMKETSGIRLDNVRRLHQAGLTILAGSDAQSGVFPGPSLHRELVTLVNAGLTPAQAIRAATLDPARYLTLNDDPYIGYIGAGKQADLLLVNGDPSLNINALADIREVMINGRLLQRTPVQN